MTTEPETKTPEQQLIEQARGALNFILAFYEPGQRHLDTEAWKQAEASGRRVHKALGEYIERQKEAARVWSDHKARPGCRVITNDDSQWVWKKTGLKNGNGDLFTRADYLDACGGMLTDGDGYGTPVNAEGFEATRNCHASQGEKELPADATHVLWFNQ